MNYTILQEHFLETFTEAQRKDIEKYNIVTELHQNGLTKRDIGGRVVISRDKLYQWRLTNIKPVAFKTYAEAEARGYFKPIGEEQLEWLAYLIGYNLGDGNISKNLCNTWFYGVNSDLEYIKVILQKFNVDPVIYTYKINNGKMAIHDRVFSRFLVCLGAIRGDKTKAKLKIPDWILNSGYASRFKKRFLQALFDSELSEIKPVSIRPHSYQSLTFYTCKTKDNTDNGIFFLNQLRNLLVEFNVMSSSVKFDRPYFRNRDKSDMQQLYFIIHTNRINLYNFIKNVGFLHNSKRRRASEIALEKIEPLAKKEQYKIDKYEEILDLRKQGLSAYKIAKIVDINVENIKSIVYYNHKPQLYNARRIVSTV